MALIFHFSVSSRKSPCFLLKASSVGFCLCQSFRSSSSLGHGPISLSPLTLGHSQDLGLSRRPHKSFLTASHSP